MKDKKKINDLKTNQKRLFMRMKSPSAFGAGRRFDSVSFMNVPPEMARRDAAYFCISVFFQEYNFSLKTAAERFELCGRIGKLLAEIEERTEFILNADIIEKRNLEKVESLAFIRLLRKYFDILTRLTQVQPEESLDPQMKELLQTLSGAAAGLLGPELKEREFQLIQSIQSVIEQIRPRLSVQRERRCKHFSKTDSERYERAYAFFAEYYKKFLTL